MKNLTLSKYFSPKLSFLGKKWQIRDYAEHNAGAIAQHLKVPDIIGRLLAARNISLEEATDFINPTLKTYLPNPSNLKDMDQAVDRIFNAIVANEKIAVFGDYDVDGATSSALLIRFFKYFDVDIAVHIPDRITEGYGPNIEAFKKLHSQNIKLIITVDCGTLAFEPLKQAKEMGVDIIVVDHHIAEPELPEAYAIINPNRLDETSDFTYLAAVGVTFLLCVALNRKFKLKFNRQASLFSLLDLVALGTVADVVPLIGLNRAFVSQGLKIIAQRQNIGLRALADIAGLSESPNSYHLGFLFGPRINAGGRIGQANLGVKLLCSQNQHEANKLASMLDELNRERQEIEAKTIEEALEIVAAEEKLSNGLTGPIIIAKENWHPGVIGIVASRLKERYYRPVIVIALDGESGKGSGRSISGIDLGAMIIAAKQHQLIEAGGGHKMAAGLTIKKNNLMAFKEFMTKRMDLGKVEPIIYADGIVSVNGANKHLINTIDQIGPYGAGHPGPKFIMSNVILLKVDVLAKNTLKLLIKDGYDQPGKPTKLFNAVAFKAADTKMGQALIANKGKKISLLGALKYDRFRNAAQLIIDDAMQE